MAGTSRELKERLRRCTTALAQSPQDPSILLEMAILLVELRRDREAIGCFTSACELYRQAGDHESAQVVLGRALELYPQDKRLLALEPRHVEARVEQPPWIDPDETGSRVRRVKTGQAVVVGPSRSRGEREEPPLEPAWSEATADRSVERGEEPGSRFDDTPRDGYHENERTQSQSADWAEASTGAQGLEDGFLEEVSVPTAKAISRWNPASTLTVQIDEADIIDSIEEESDEGEEVFASGSPPPPPDELSIADDPRPATAARPRGIDDVKTRYVELDPAEVRSAFSRSEAPHEADEHGGRGAQQGKRPDEREPEERSDHERGSRGGRARASTAPHPLATLSTMDPVRTVAVELDPHLVRRTLEDAVEEQEGEEGEGEGEGERGGEAPLHLPNEPAPRGMTFKAGQTGPAPVIHSAPTVVALLPDHLKSLRRSAEEEKPSREEESAVELVPGPFHGESFPRIPFPAEFLALGKKRPCDEREILFRDGETSNELFMLASGRLEVVKAPPDLPKEEVVLEVIEAGTCFGELAMLGDGVRHASVRALEPSEVLSFTKNQVKSLMRISQEVNLALRNTYRLRLQHNLVKLSSLFRPVGPDAALGLLGRAKPIRVAVGDVALREGTASPGLHFVMLGHLEAECTRGGRTFVLNHLGDSDCFGAVSLLRHSPVFASVTAKSFAQILCVTEPDTVAFGESHPAFLEALHALVEKREQEYRSILEGHAQIEEAAGGLVYLLDRKK
jgi:CRP/FNR family transcriptional regulator, cyclic AMP receptor protein